MPNEISALEGVRTIRPDGSEVETFTLFFLRTIDAPVQVGGINVIPTPADGPAGEDLLPALARRILDQVSEIDALNAGTMEWGTIAFVQPPGMSNAELAAEARRMYAAWKGDREADYPIRYRWAGTRINEVP